MLPFGSSGWRLCDRPDCRGGDRVSATVSQSHARAWLLGHSTDMLKMGAWRQLVARASARPTEEMFDDALIDALAGLIAQGRVHVHAAPRAPIVARVVSVPAAPPPAPPPERRVAPKASLRGSAIDPPMFSVNLDQQAAALINAANQGAPFCPI